MYSIPQIQYHGKMKFSRMKYAGNSSKHHTKAIADCSRVNFKYSQVSSLDLNEYLSMPFPITTVLAFSILLIDGAMIE